MLYIIPFVKKKINIYLEIKCLLYLSISSFLKNKFNFNFDLNFQDQNISLLSLWKLLQTNRYEKCNTFQTNFKLERHYNISPDAKYSRSN